MNFPYEALHAAAYKNELRRSRRLARGLGCSEQIALTQILRALAPAGDLAGLLAARAAERLARARHEAARASRRTAQLERHHAARAAAPAPGWHASFDGSARPNPGRLGIGAQLCGPAGEVIEISRSAGLGDSSDAEYAALQALLAAALQAGVRRLSVQGDSRVVLDDVERARRGAGPLAGRLATQRAAVLAQLAQFEQISLKWVPRAKNGVADALSQRAIGYDNGPCPATGCCDE